MPRLSVRHRQILHSVLAASLMLAGTCVPVRFGHAHAYQGDHAHHVAIQFDSPHEDHDHHADYLAVEADSFHWHAGLLLPGGNLPSSGPRPADDHGVQPSLLGMSAPPSSPGLAASPFLTPALDISWLPPPAFSPRSDTQFTHLDMPEPACPLIGCVLIRC